MLAEACLWERATRLTEVSRASVYSPCQSLRNAGGVLRFDEAPPGRQRNDNSIWQVWARRRTGREQRFFKKGALPMSYFGIVNQFNQFQESGDSDIRIRHSGGQGERRN